MKISIVVPVYNVELYLERCVESLIAQNYVDKEILLINDGSTDNSSAICDEYKEKYDNINVIHQDNSGLSGARNTGIINAKGDYILFVDSDDTIDANTCQSFADVLEGRVADLVVGNIRKIKGKNISFRKHTIKNSNEVLKGEEFLTRELEAGSMHMAAVLCLYRTDFLRKNNLYFKSRILHEDEEFTPRVFAKAERVIPTDILFYNHHIREGSITQQKSLIKNAESIYLICNELETYFNHLENTRLKKLIMEHLVDISFKIFFDAKLYKRANKHLVNIDFIKRNAKSKKNKTRMILFLSSRRALYTLNYLRLKIRKLRQGVIYD